MSIGVTARPSNGSARGGGEEPLAFRVFSWGIFLAVCLSIAIPVLAGIAIVHVSLPELALWIGLVALASLVSFVTRGGLFLAMDMPVLLAAGFIHGPILAGAVGLVACLDPREFRREVSLGRALMNRSQIAASVMLAALVFQGLGARLGGWPIAAIAALLAVVADGIVNYSLVGLATALRSGRSFARVLNDMHFGSIRAFLPTYACFGFMGVLIAESYESLGFLGVVGFVAPVVVATQMFTQWRRAEDARSALEVKSQALKRVDERIADERRDERARIASALHDDVLQSLYNVTIRTQVIREDLRGGHLLELDDDIPALLCASEQAVDELRDVIRDLRKSAIGHAGLVDTLMLLTAHLHDESGIQFVSSLDASVSADASIELRIYQVAREAMTNCVKHSGAETVWVSLSQVGSGIQLLIEDDGRGFDPQQAQDTRHFGLVLMRERAEQAGGSLEIASSVGAGAVVTALFPSGR